MTPNKRLAEEIKSKLMKQFDKMGDKIQTDLQMNGDQVTLFYLKSMCNPNTVQEQLVNRFYELADIQEYHRFVRSFPSCKEAKDAKDAADSIITGFVAVFIEGEVYLFEAIRAEGSSVGSADTENVIQGPKDAFTESLEINMNMIRRRYKSSDLKTEFLTAGKLSQTKLAIVYDITRVDPEVLDQVRRRIQEMDADVLQAASELEQFTMKPRFRLFPTLMVSERPDRAVLNLAQGKVVVLFDTINYVLLLPSIFNDFFTTMDDRIQLPPVGWFLKGIRYIGLAVTLLMPALYVAFTSYNPEILKMQITLLIAGSRATVPYPSFFEVLFMLLAMEFLTEASVRLPKAIGPTATTVGGLILGTAATEAGLVSDIMIILVSAVAITNFIIPVPMMSLGVRVAKYIFILLSTFFGLVGICVGIVAMIMYLCGLRSFGKPYLRMFAVESIGRGGRKNG